ncbi:MAG TPA: ABC transporter substrate-binding protein [Methylomirabilota bacterium]|nr:ABC transporter substrate-binding protein [Methylomirabilota bacterium]
MSMLRSGRLPVLAAAVCLVFAVPAAAAPAVDPNRAVEVVNHAVDDAFKTFAGKGLSQDEAHRAADDLIRRYTDLRVLSAAILGRYWTAASPADQEKFLTLLVNYAIAGWASQIISLDPKDKITIAGAVPAGETVRVHAVSTSPGEDPTPVDFIVSAADGRLIISDALIENVSFIRTMHDDFSAFLGSNGGRLEALMAAMQKKIDANSVAGAPAPPKK